LPLDPTLRYSGAVNISSFHTHTRLCRHASGDPVDSVRVAAAEGCTGLGISDHCPYPGGLWAGSRMAPEWLDEYLVMVDAARDIAPFPFYWGFECEWHPDSDAWYREYLRGELGAEYLVYGAHWVRTSNGFEYIPEAGDPGNLAPYVDLTVKGLASGLFDLFAHPDIFLAGFPRWDAETRAASRDIVDAAVAMGIPLEVNGLGLTKPKVLGDAGWRAPYPVREFLEFAADSGAVLTCNSDAHRPQDTLALARNAKAQAEAWGIPTVDAMDALAFTKRGAAV